MVAKAGMVDDFFARMAQADVSFLSQQKHIAVGVSGGPDSMALCFLLSRWATQHDVQIHALTVDHGLRAESWQEAEAVHAWLSGWPHVVHHILKWEHAGVDSALQERARDARYGLMSTYCADHDIGALLLAHHGDDQAETVLFRLAKGSGLDGLAGMASVYDYSDSLKLVRPLLDITKQDLVALCAAENIPSLQDPSNENDDFARVRLREARSVLEAEGLTTQRLSITAKRLARAKDALDKLVDKVAAETFLQSDTNSIVFVFNDIEEQDPGLFSYPYEIVLRVLKAEMEGLNPQGGYGVRLEKLEVLVDELINLDIPFRKRTLGGVIFERDDDGGHVKLTREHKDD